jgi:hypothetical protein
MTRLRLLATVLLIVAMPNGTSSQTGLRRLSTVAALQQYAGYYHLQSVLLHGEFVESGSRTVLRGGDLDLPVLLNDERTLSGLVAVRGQMIDVGRLEPGDPRLALFDRAQGPERWPRPGEELLLSVTGVSQAQLATSPSVRGLALQPWRFEGQEVTVVGQFRGRNLFGDLPSAPGQSRYDFVLRSADAAVWVTTLPPKGRGFDLSVDARVDTGRWLEVSGSVSMDRGLVVITGKTVELTTAPDIMPEAEEAPAPPPEAAEVIFSSPTEGDLEVSPTRPVRLQFSRGLDPASIDGQIRVTYAGAGTSEAAAPAFEHAYDLDTRAIEIMFTNPLERFRTVTVELLDGIRTFDGAPVVPSTLTFSTGG